MMGSVLALQFQMKAKMLMTRYATQTCQGFITLRTLVSDFANISIVSLGRTNPGVTVDSSPPSHSPFPTRH